MFVLNPWMYSLIHISIVYELCIAISQIVLNIVLGYSYFLNQIHISSYIILFEVCYKIQRPSPNHEADTRVIPYFLSQFQERSSNYVSDK